MPDKFQVRHGKAIRRIREARDLLGKQLADAAGMSAGQLSEIENGRRKLTAKTFEKLANALDLSQSDFRELLERESVAETASAVVREDPALYRGDPFRDIARKALARLPSVELAKLLEEAVADTANGRKNRIAEARLMLDILESRQSPQPPKKP